MGSRSHNLLLSMCGGLALTASSAIAVRAQERIPIEIEPTAPSESVIIDVLRAPDPLETPTAAEVQQCRDEQDAGTISGEIVVCRELAVDNSDRFSGGREAWERDYARRTAFANDLRPPDVAGPGIFRGPATVSGLCLIGPCPKPPAITVDFAALEEAPAGSDADRIGRGLAPIGVETDVTGATKKILEAELGLPPADHDKVVVANSAESEAPEERR